MVVPGLLGRFCELLQKCYPVHTASYTTASMTPHMTALTAMMYACTSSSSSTSTDSPWQSVQEHCWALHLSCKS